LTLRPCLDCGEPAAQAKLDESLKPVEAELVAA
jgi:hypothetical protein